MVTTVQLAGTELRLPQFQFVALEEPTNQPEDTQKTHFFAHALGGLWPQRDEGTTPIYRGDVSILVHHADVIPINDFQMVMFTRLVERQGLPLSIHPLIGEPTTLMVTFPHITIGIEPDGHAHS